jgi:hypothetical protein
MTERPAKKARSGESVRGWIRALISLVVVFCLSELVLRAKPELLPEWYRAGFPMRGIEFSRPGILSATPIEALPLPWIAGPWDGPPPADLVEKGLLAPDVELDRLRYPRVQLPSDGRGLPNRAALDRASVLLVGDSFLVAAASSDPPGLARLLEERIGDTVYNLGVAGVGPQREAWLLEEVGSDLDPDLVLWFFFGGNDLVDARRLRDRIEAGVVTHSEDEDYRALPALRLPDMVRTRLAHRAAGRAEVAPVSFPSVAGPHPFWFLPRHLYMLSMPIETLRGHRGWEPTRFALRESRRAVEARGGKFAVVYLPSKAQVYLSSVEQDAGRFYRMLTFDGGVPLPAPEVLLQQMLDHRGDLEELVRGFCEAEGIPLFTATPILEGMAERGELAYLTCDTHWAPSGQNAVAEPLAQFSLDLLGR